MALITQSDIEARLGRTLTAEEVTTFTTVNAAVQAHIEENIIGSSVEAENEATRYYDGGVQHLSINPCTDITAVKYVDDDQAVVETYDTTDYTKEPINKTLKTYLRHRSGFARGINNIAVTAKFSIYDDANVLAVVKNAILDLVKLSLSHQLETARESIEGYSKDYTNATTLINAYREYPSIAALYSLFPEV